MSPFLLLLVALIFSDIRLFSQTAGKLLRRNPLLFASFFLFLCWSFIVSFPFGSKWGARRDFGSFFPPFSFFFGAFAGYSNSPLQIITLVKDSFLLVSPLSFSPH